MQLPGCDMSVPALLGLEYPDPMGSGLSVPVLGSQADLLTGSTVPLAGTMEDPSGTGTSSSRETNEVLSRLTRSPDKVVSHWIIIIESY